METTTVLTNYDTLIVPRRLAMSEGFCYTSRSIRNALG